MVLGTAIRVWKGPILTDNHRAETTTGVATDAGPGRRRVGWIGLGDQGLPMAAAIARAGHELQVWARRPEALDGLGDLPYVRHDSVGDLAAASEIIGLCVGTDADVEDLLTGGEKTHNGGILGSAGAGVVVVNHGTGTPGNARRFAELGAAVRVAVLDAPVSGGRPAAEQERLLTMVGGSPDAAKAAQAVFDTFSSHVVHVSGAGSGQTAKLFNNALMILNQAAIADIFALTPSFEVDPLRLFEVLKLGSAGSTVLNLFTTMINTDTVDHLAGVEAEDVKLFDRALREAGADPGEVTARALTGAGRMADVLALLTPADARTPNGGEHPDGRRRATAGEARSS